MWEAFREGGWGMFPTLFFGLALVGVGVRYALAPERRLVPLLAGLGLVTLLAGTLGFAVGLQVTFQGFAGSDPPARLALVGIAESLQNVVLALALVLLATLAACAGALRLARQPAET